MPDIPATGVTADAVPEQYRAWVREAAQQYGVSEQFLRNILTRESNWNTNPTTGAPGVRGLAQIGDSTANRYGINNRDPRSSIFGAAMLLRRFSNPVDAAIAYNWGDGAFRRWNQAGRDFNRLPGETRRYLNNVLGGVTQGLPWDGPIDTSDLPVGFGDQYVIPEGEIGPDTGVDLSQRGAMNWSLSDDDWAQALNPNWQPGTMPENGDFWGTPAWTDPPSAPSPQPNSGIGPALEQALRGMGLWPPGTNLGGPGQWQELLQNQNPFIGGSYQPPNPIDQYAPGSPPFGSQPLPGLTPPLPLPTFGGPSGTFGPPDYSGPGAPLPLPPIPIAPGGNPLISHLANPNSMAATMEGLKKGDSRGGVVPYASGGRAMGGAPVMVKPYVRRAGQRGMGGNKGKGLIKTAGPGRTDNVPMSVNGGSYVLPADVVSGVGENNTLAGARKLDTLFKNGPYQSGATPSLQRAAPKFMPQRSASMIRQRFASGGKPKTPIVVAGGEYLLEPETVAEIGGGDAERGFEILDAFVKAVRKHNIKTLSKLPGPKR